MEIVTRKKYSQAPIVTVQSHANALELVVTALYYNPPLTLSILSKHGQTEAFFKQWFLKLGTFTRVHDRKICILAITALFSSLPDQLGSMPGVPGQLMQAALSCFDGLPKALESEWEVWQAGFDVTAVPWPTHLLTPLRQSPCPLASSRQTASRWRTTLQPAMRTKRLLDRMTISKMTSTMRMTFTTRTTTMRKCSLRSRYVVQLL